MMINEILSNIESDENHLETIISQIEEINRKILLRQYLPVHEQICQLMILCMKDHRFFGVFFRQPKQKGMNALESDTNSRYSYFNFLSFIIKNGSKIEFSDRHQVLYEYRKLSKNPNLLKRRTPNIVTFFSKDVESEKLIDAITNLLISYFSLSLTFDNFLSRTTERMFLSLNRGQNIISDSINFLEKTFNVDVAYYVFAKNGEGERTLILQYHSRAFNSDNVDSIMMNELRYAIRTINNTCNFRRNRGKLDEVYYLILPVTDSELQRDHEEFNTSSLDNTGELSSTKILPRRMGVFLVMSKFPIQTMCLSYLRSMIREYTSSYRLVGRIDSTATMHSMKNFEINKLYNSPLRTTSSAFLLFQNYSEKICEHILVNTLAHSCVVRIYDPFRKVLKPIATRFSQELSTPSAQAKEINVRVDGKFPSVNADVFLNCENGSFVYLQDILENDNEGVFSFRNETKCELCLPISINGINIGTINIESSIIYAFERDIQYCSHLSDLISDFIKSVYYASDAAWLPKLSFIHFAIHRIEKLKRTASPGVSENIQAIAQHLSPEYIDPQLDSSIDFLDCTDRVVKFVERYNFSVSPKNMIEIRGTYPEKMSARIAHSLEVILENIIENAIQHSSLKDKIILNFGRKLDCLGKSSAAYSLEIVYDAQRGRNFAHDIEHVGIAPQWSDNDETYHIGMFLVGVHVRLIGGELWVDNERRANCAARNFRVRIHLPIQEETSAEEP